MPIETIRFFTAQESSVSIYEIIFINYINHLKFHQWIDQWINRKLNRQHLIRIFIDQIKNIFRFDANMLPIFVFSRQRKHRANIRCLFSIPYVNSMNSVA